MLTIGTTPRHPSRLSEGRVRIRLPIDTRSGEEVKDPMTHNQRRFILRGLAVVVALLISSGKARGYSNTGYHWKEIGPAPSCCFFSGESGRATAIAVNPFNKDDVWIGTAGGGVWHSTDAGANWKAMSDNQASLA